MTELVITRGLPASGKSTWAARWVREAPGRAEVNRDHLRLMLHGGFVADAETRVTRASHTLIETLLTQGVSVVCSDTNLPQRHARDIAKIGRKAGADVRVQDFTDVPLETCLSRNRGRVDGYVPENVIRDMHTRYVKGRTYPLPLPEEDSATGTTDLLGFDPELETVVIVDIDGTVAKMGDRKPYDYTKVSLDTPKRDVIEVIEALFNNGNGYKIVFMSGREGTEQCRTDTYAWICRHINVWTFELHMRPAGDMRKDSIVKRELVDRHIRGKYNVLGVFDDRNQVVNMWREELGLTCYQVAPGNF